MLGIPKRYFCQSCLEYSSCTQNYSWNAYVVQRLDLSCFTTNFREFSVFRSTHFNYTRLTDGRKLLHSIGLKLFPLYSCRCHQRVIPCQSEFFFHLLLWVVNQPFFSLFSIQLWLYSLPHACSEKYALIYIHEVAYIIFALQGYYNKQIKCLTIS